MLKINYPSPTTAMHKRYLDCFDIDAMQLKLDALWRKSSLKKFSTNNVKDILVMPIEDLAKLSADLGLNKAQPNHLEVKKIFNYDYDGLGKSYQPAIADFFMESPELNISTCFFCNIDHINYFTDLGDFENGLDLVKRGCKEELLKIKGLGNATVQTILKQRNVITKLGDLKIPKTVIKNLEKMEINSKANHFTLDHVLDKATHPIAALSLYNFVPCCYSCNSKFKGSKPLISDKTQFSPTSKDFSFPDDVRFKVLFPSDSSKQLPGISTVKDFVLSFEIDKDQTEYENYLRIFKLKARYVFHKREVVNMVEKSKAYSDSRLQEIAKITKRSMNELKADIYGHELFDKSNENKPLTKLKKDIAQAIGIIKRGS